MRKILYYHLLYRFFADIYYYSISQLICLYITIYFWFLFLFSIGLEYIILYFYSCFFLIMNFLQFVYILQIYNIKSILLIFSLWYYRYYYYIQIPSTIGILFSYPDNNWYNNTDSILVFGFNIPLFYLFMDGI